MLIIVATMKIQAAMSNEQAEMNKQSQMNKQKRTFREECWDELVEWGHQSELIVSKWRAMKTQSYLPWSNPKVLCLIVVNNLNWQARLQNLTEQNSRECISACIHVFTYNFKWWNVHFMLLHYISIPGIWLSRTNNSALLQYLHDKDISKYNLSPLRHRSSHSTWIKFTEDRPTSTWSRYLR